MTRRLTLILGGARSGKSSYAEKLAAEQSPDPTQTALYVATAQAFDAEMAARIAAHQAQRPAHWLTLEAPHKVGQAILATVNSSNNSLKGCRTGWIAVVLIDCITLLANNVIAPLPEPYDEASATAALMPEIEDLLAAYHEQSAAWIIISNEVGLGIVPPYALGRAYRDALGRANQRLAACADEVFLMVAGLPLKVK
jgi:adenosylcobinamide kinase/adenosylcobinamide-phosphate guanylyltransferase